MNEMNQSDYPIRIDSKPNWTLGLSWPLIVWFLALLILFTGDTMLADPDSYWHVAAGRWILSHHEIPSHDPFSYSSAGTSWVAHEWLAEVIFSLLHSLSGWSGLVVLTACAFAATLAGMTRHLLRVMEPVHALIFVAMSAALLKTHLLARPHMLAAPLLALWVAGLVSAREKDQPPHSWLLLIMLLWANLHGSFTLGVALAGALGVEAVVTSSAESRQRTAWRWGRFVLLAAVTALFTPEHVRGLLFTLQVHELGSVLEHIGEWRSPNFQEFQPFEAWLILMLAVGMMGRVRVPWLRAVVILGLVHLTLQHGRYAAVTGILTPFLIAPAFGRQWRMKQPPGTANAGTLDAAFRALASPARWRGWVLTSVLTMALIIPTLRQTSLQPRANITPTQALQVVRQLDTPVRLFNEYSFGGYLIYEGIPVFIDGRADMYGEKFFKRYLEATQAKKISDLTDLLDEYNVTATLLRPSMPAATILDLLPGWTKRYADDTAVIHVREAH